MSSSVRDIHRYGCQRSSTGNTGESMDFYGFINFRDIRKYLKEINYQFTVPEAAYIVYQSHERSLEKKILAWETIINTTEDCSWASDSSGLAAIKSFHD